MKFASIIPASLLALLFFGGFASPSVGQESRWGSPGEETVKFIIAAEAKWANSACSPQPDLKEVIADDSQGHRQADGATARRTLSPQIPRRSSATANWAR